MSGSVPWCVEAYKEGGGPPLQFRDGFLFVLTIYILNETPFGFEVNRKIILLDLIFCWELSENVLYTYLTYAKLNRLQVGQRFLFHCVNQVNNGNSSGRGLKHL